MRMKILPLLIPLLELSVTQYGVLAGLTVYAVPQVLADRVEYLDVAPWSTMADGTGPSLQRASTSVYGNDPLNWSGPMDTWPA